MRLIVLSTNKQRDENIFPVLKVLKEKFGVTIDYVQTNDFHSKSKPAFINEWLHVETKLRGQVVKLDATENYYKRRFRNLTLLKVYLTEERLRQYDALLIGGDDYLGRYFLKKFRGKPRFLIQDGLFFNVTSRLIYEEIIKVNRTSLPAYLFFMKYLMKETLIKVFKFFDLSYIFFSYSGNSEFDMFFLSGTYTEKLLIEQGISTNRLFISGMPRFQYLFRSIPNPIQKSAPFNKAPYAISFMTGAYKNHSQFEMDVCEKKFLKELCKLIKRLDCGIQLYIKVHPRDPIQDFDQYGENDFVTVISDVPIERVLSESDIILANASTTSVEAAFMDTPVIITLVSFIQTFKFSSYYSYDRNYYCVAETWHELEEYIIKILKDQEYRKEIISRQRLLTESLICSETVNSDVTIAREIFTRVSKVN